MYPYLNYLLTTSGISTNRWTVACKCDKLVIQDQPIHEFVLYPGYRAPFVEGAPPDTPVCVASKNPARENITRGASLHAGLSRAPFVPNEEAPSTPTIMVTSPHTKQSLLRRGNDPCLSYLSGRSSSCLCRRHVRRTARFRLGQRQARPVEMAWASRCCCERYDSLQNTVR